MKTSFTILITLLLAPLAGLAAAESTKLNVLFISVDDLNDFPAFAKRYPDAKTPHMDQLAKRGMIFSNAHSQFPLCGPSRASVMSGLLPSTLGYDDHMKDEALEKRAKILGTDLLHTYFAKQGYKTMAVGKILHHHVPEGSVDASGGRGSTDGGTGKLAKNWSKDGTSTDWAMAPDRDEDLPDYKAASWAAEQLAQNHDKPFFLMVGILRPHVPFYVPKKWFDLYDREKITLPSYNPNDFDDIPAIAQRISILPQMPRTDWAIKNDQWRDIVHAYLACISFADHQVGRVLEALDNSAYKNNTLIVLWSDHGYHMGEKNTFQKQSLWERASHVPMLVAGPQIHPGQHCDRVVSLLDLYPTLVELCDLPTNPKNEGRSLSPLLKDPTKDWPYPAITGWKEHSFAIETETHRYLRYGDGSEELYDHRTDINEWTNLAQRPENSVLKKSLAEWIPKPVAKPAQLKKQKHPEP